MKDDFKIAFAKAITVASCTVQTRVQKAGSRTSCLLRGTNAKTLELLDLFFFIKGLFKIRPLQQGHVYVVGRAGLVAHVLVNLGKAQIRPVKGHAVLYRMVFNEALEACDAQL